MNFVIDTNILHIEQELWDDEIIRDVFLDSFLKHLSFIELCQDSKIFWSNQIEALLWESPSLPPWRLDKDFRHQIVPIIYKKFLASHKYIEINSIHDECDFLPTIQQHSKYEKAFRELCETLIIKEYPFYMLLHSTQTLPSNSQFVFSCTNQVKKTFIKGENCLNKWLQNIEFLNYIWPKNINDASNFQQIMEICTKNENNIYTFTLSNNFITSILNIDNRYKIKLTQAIANRLCMTRSQAVSSSFREETIGDENRMRITPRPSSTRLHFIFNHNQIIFQKFYGEGEHDDGL